MKNLKCFTAGFLCLLLFSCASNTKKEKVASETKKQVLIQITAVEVNLSDKLEHGFEYAVNQVFRDAEGNITNKTQTDTPMRNISALFKNAGVDNGLDFVRVVTGDIGSKLLFSPQILTMNGEEAEINIGQEVPIRSGASPTDGNSHDSIEYRDTGILINVTPHINVDNKIALDINCKWSRISAETIPGTGSPVFDESNIIYRGNINNTETILLSEIITKGKPTNSPKTELLVFIKTTIIK